MNARQSLISGGSLEDRSRPTAFSRSRIIRLESWLALGLVTAAFSWSWLRHLGLLAHLRASGSDLLVGLLAASALCLSLPFFTSAWASRVLLLREMKGVWDDLLTPFGKSLTLAEISALAALSGISEELFFRGAVQGTLGWAAATILFALLHSGPGRAFRLWSLFALLAGALFGGVMAWRGNLLGPVVGHFLVNAVNLRRLASRFGDSARLAEGGARKEEEV